MRLIAILLLLFPLYTYATAQSNPKKNYRYGAYIVKMNYCSENSSLEILKDDKQLYYTCSGDGLYYYIDTLSLNDDGIPDFITGYQMEDYVVLSVLVSAVNNSYKDIEIAEIMLADIYSNTHLSNGEVYRDFKLTDIDKDGKKDIITNIIIDAAGNIKPTDMTETMLHNELRRIANK
jgi:hypothetical protein